MTEDDVFEAVRQLVLAREYRDTRFIQIGPLPERPRKVADGSPEPGSFSKYMRHMPVTEQVMRCSPDYPAARDGGLLKPLPPLVTATPEAIAEADAVIGYPLPRLLRRLYLEVGNGGFGPHTGILGIRGGLTDENGEDLVQLQLERQTWPDPLYPLWLVDIFYWGCNIRSLIDCRDPTGPMWCYDGETLRQPDQTICDWLALWLECRLEMPEGTAPPTTEESRRLRAEWQAANPGESFLRRIT